MLSSLYTSETGVMAMQKGFDVISNNLANINSIGFKKYDITFHQLFSKSYKHATENTNPMQAGAGSNDASIRRILTEGNYLQTSNPTDMSIGGNGFFILNNDVDNHTYYSKAGSFKFDPGKYSDIEGYPKIGVDGNVYYLGNPSLIEPLNLVNAGGAFVQGWNADVLGNFDYSKKLENITIDNDRFFMPPKETTSVILENNVDSTAKITQFNESSIIFSRYDGNLVLPDDEFGLVGLRGNALNDVKGVYEVNIDPDGSALVKFIPDDNSPEEIFSYPAGTIDFNPDGFSYNTEIIPGIELKIAGEITETITAEINNTGFVSGDSYMTTSTVYDSSGQAHELLIKFDRVGVNEWVWEPKLMREEFFKGTGQAFTVVVNDKIDTELPLSVTIRDLNTGETEEISMGKSSVFENNKIVVSRYITENQVVDVSYTSADSGETINKTFSQSEIAESFVLDNIPDPESIQIFVGSSSVAIPRDHYEIIDNVIVPVDLDGDGNNDSPFVGKGLDVRVKYVNADAIVNIERFNRDVITGTGKLTDFELANAVDDSNVSITVVNTITDAKRTLNINDFIVESNKLIPKDPENSSLIIKKDEKVIFEYQGIEEPITQNETLTYDGTTRLHLSGTPASGTLKLYDESGELIPESTWTVSGNRVVFIDGDNDGTANLPGEANMKIRAEYEIKRPNHVNINFNQFGEHAGGSTNAKVDFGIKYPVTINFDMSNVFQFAGYSDAHVSFYDGHAAGTLTNIGVNNEGIITGYYDNSISRDIARVALATFNNPQDLTSAGNGYYLNNSNSIEARINQPGVFSEAGVIFSKRLENSNVNLADEFSNLIIMQRAFQLNSKGITTSNEMMQQAINLKR